MAVDDDHERSPLLQQNGRDHSEERDRNQGAGEEVVEFGDGDKENPRNWTKARKMVNVGIIALMASELYF